MTLRLSGVALPNSTLSTFRQYKFKFYISVGRTRAVKTTATDQSTPTSWSRIRRFGARWRPSRAVSFTYKTSGVRPVLNCMRISVLVAVAVAVTARH